MVQESNVATEMEVGTNLTPGQADNRDKEEQTRDDITNTNDVNVCENKSETNGFQQEDFENYTKDDPLNISKKCLDSQCKMNNEDKTDVQYFKCPSLNCNLSFENFTSLKLHAHINHNRRLNATHMRLHQVQKVHSVKSARRSEENKPIHNHESHSICACSLCGRKFRTKEKREHHEANHSNMKFKCSCGYLFLESSGYKSHLQYAHQSLTEVQEANQNVVMYECPVNQCGCLYENFLELIAHTVGYHGTRLTKEERKACRINDNVLNKETTNDISGDATQIQNQDKESKSEDSLPANLKGYKNSKKNNNNFPQCDLCKRRFVKESKRDWHVLHHNEMTYKCPVEKCEQLFEIFVNLQQHCTSRHNFPLRACDKEMCKINQAQNENVNIKRTTHFERVIKMSSRGTDSSNFQEDLAKSSRNTEDVHFECGSVNSSLSGDEIIVVDDHNNDNSDYNPTENNVCGNHKSKQETDQSVQLRENSGNDDRDVEDDRSSNDFNMTDIKEQRGVDNRCKEFSAQEPTSNLIDDFSQVMTDFILDNEAGAKLNYDNESAERGFQMLDSVLQNEVHSSQVVHEPQEKSIEPLNFINIQNEKVLENDNVADENKLRRQSNSEHDTFKDAVPEKRKRLTEPEMDNLAGNRNSSTHL